MNFIHTQRLRALKRVTFTPTLGESDDPAHHASADIDFPFPPPRWQWNKKATWGILALIVALTALSVWAHIGHTLLTPQHQDLVSGTRYTAHSPGAAHAKKDTGNLVPDLHEQGESAQGSDTEEGNAIYNPENLNRSDSTNSTGEKQANARGVKRANGAAQEIYVHVAGAVKTPGVVRLVENARVFDALDKAGGARSDADVSAVNLAAHVSDGSFIYIPTVGEVLQGGGALSPAAQASAGTATTPRQALGGGGLTMGSGTCVDINQADVVQLQELPGIGPGLAQRIVSHRQEHGPFGRVADLDEVSGIGQKLIHRIESSVCS